MTDAMIGLFLRRFGLLYITDARLSVGNILEILLNSFISSDILGEFTNDFGTPNKPFTENDYFLLKMHTILAERTKKS